MTRCFLGVDIGNSKSHALITDEAGRALGLGIGGPGNHEVLGVEGFRATLHKIVADALAEAGLNRSQIAGAGFGVAGYDWPSDDPLMTQVIDSLGLSAPYCFVNDSVIGLVAGAQQGWGVVVAAGTSVNCRGRDLQGREGRITGNGWLFGEYGGGIELVYQALHAISRAWSLRGPATLLSQLFVDYHGARDTADLFEGIARGRYQVKAKQAELVFEAVRQGDPLAHDLMVWSGRELSDLALGVIRQLNFAGLEFEVVLAGNLYKGSPLIEQTMRETIGAAAPGATLVRLEAPPVVGGAMLGMERVGLDFTRVRARMIETTNQLLHQQEKV
jgi:N-acetylglucosamine kinase-like BadF-type ATPase